MSDIIDRLNDQDTCMDAIDDAIAEIKRLRAENAELREANRWNFVFETRPPIEMPVIAQFQHGETGRTFSGVTVFYEDKRGLYWLVLNDYSLSDLPREYVPVQWGLLPLPPAPDVTKSVTE